MDKVFIAVALLLLITSYSQAKRLELQWNSFDCLINPDIISFNRCYIVQPAKTRISIEMGFNRDIPAEYNASAVLYMPRRPFNDFYKALELNIDLCQFFRGKNSNIFVSSLFKAITKHSNMTRKCPQPKGLYHFTNMSIGEHLPAFVPKTNFKVQLDLFMPSVPVLNISLVGRLI